MRAFIIAIVAVIVSAFLGRYAVNEIWQQTADQEFSSSTNVWLSHEEAAATRAAEIGLLKALKCRWTRHGKVSQIRAARPKAQTGRCYLIWRPNRRQTKPSRPELGPEDRLRERRPRAQERRRQRPAPWRAESLR